MKSVNFLEVGQAYVGQSAKGKSYIRLHLNEETASTISYNDLCYKVYLFASDKGKGQYSICAPVSINQLTKETK